MEKLYKEQWEESYVRHENHIFYPKEEVVKFLSLFVRKRIGREKYIDILTDMHNGGAALDFGCGIGRMTKLLNEFGMNAKGIDISEQAIANARQIYPEMKEGFQVFDGLKIPFVNGFFDVTISEGVLDSMHFSQACEVVGELERVTKKYLFASFISGDDSTHNREYAQEEIVSCGHESGTVQSYFNWGKILSLFDKTAFEINSAKIITEESLTNQYKYGRYYVVLEK